MRLRKLIRPLSLRWRLTLGSSLVVAIVFASFTGVAYLTVRNINEIWYEPIYNSIDSDMSAFANANLLYMLKNKQLILPINQIGNVYFAVFDKEGKQVSGNQSVPISDSLFQQVLNQPMNGERPVMETIPLPNGVRARVLLYPIDLLVSGEMTRMGVIVAITPIELLDQFTNEIINQEIKKYFALGGIILLLVVAGGTYIVSGRALRPVANVIKQARNIETSRDLSQRIRQPESDRQIGSLVDAFNQMLGRLESAFAAQRRFVADSSHELRTPITVIRGNLHLMRKAVNPAERTELINITEGEVSRLNRMVNDLLYMAQIQAGYDLKPVLRPVELDSLLLDVFALGRSMAALKEQKITLVHEDVATVSGDREQLQHLLLNLIDNAVKYTPEHGRVTLGVWSEEGWARIEVGDTGPGISKEDMPQMFDRFFRSQEARMTSRDGAGLGLSIVKSIVEAHNGQIDVYSKKGEGATFRVWLPLSVVSDEFKVQSSKFKVEEEPLKVESSTLNFEL